VILDEGRRDLRRGLDALGELHQAHRQTDAVTRQARHQATTTSSSMPGLFIMVGDQRERGRRRGAREAGTWLASKAAAPGKAPIRAVIRGRRPV
jgi:hypothetical protein